jgi:hypothetical protein
MIFLLFWRAAANSPSPFTETLLTPTEMVDSLSSLALISSFEPIGPVILITRPDDNDEYDEPDSDLMLFHLLSVVIVLVVIISGLYLYHRWALDEDQNNAYTRDITEEGDFNFTEIERDTPLVT